MIIALDPLRFPGGQAERYLAQAETLFEQMADQQARVPGERRHHNRAQSRLTGVTLPAALVEDIDRLTEA